MTSELRVLESWHDEDASPVDESSYLELADLSSSNGWSADEMFKYNEKMHKITSNYSEKTLINNYTTPLPENNSKYSIKLASKLAKEIEDRVLAEGRITPESSDDDELFEKERKQKRSTSANNNKNKPTDTLTSQLKNFQRQLIQANHQLLNSNGNSGNNNKIGNKEFLASLVSSPVANNNLHNQSSSSSNNNNNNNNNNNANKSKDSKTAGQRSSTRYNNSNTTTDITSTASRLASSLIINEAIMKPSASSSRNILRTCLTNRANICV